MCSTPPSWSKSSRATAYVYTCTPTTARSIEYVPLTVSKFAACVADINAWLSVCRLRLNTAKTQLLWLRSSQLLDKVDCHDVLVLGTRVAISDTLATSVLSSTVSCRWRPMSRPSVAPATTSDASYDQ